MVVSIRNLIVRLIAAFISDRDARHEFINKYEKKSKFKKLREDNKRLFQENQEIKIQNEQIKRLLYGIDRFITYFMLGESRLKPIDDVPTKEYPRVYLSIVCTSKNEGPYIKEWIEYHKLIGVERFYFYDNGSTDDTKEVLEPYIQDGTVIYKYIEGDGLQDRLYGDAVYRYHDQTRWLAAIDLDEFIVPKENDSLRDFLKNYEDYPGLSINWVCFDSNGHETKPSENGGLVTANYTRVRKDYQCEKNKEIKTIHNPSRVALISHHFAFYTNLGYAVTENFELIGWGPLTRRHSSTKIQVNHYFTKSREEFLKKRNRGKAFSYGKHELNEDDINFSGETTEDLAIQRFVPKLKAAMGIDN